jgi:uncharacterized membrane protein
MRTSATPKVLAIALTAGACIWIFAIIGATAKRAGDWHGLVYGLASTVCHQRPERSFFLNGRQFPVCGRCAGLYLSGALAAVVAWFGGRRSPRDSRKLLLIAAVPTALTIPVEWSGLWPLSNVIRATAALPLGAAAGWTFVRALRSEGISSRSPERA